MSKSFENLNVERQTEYYKDPSEENFLDQFNEALQELETSLYKNKEVAHPFIFTFGPPRSGTTLITQLIAHCLDTGYINNFIARFWKAPVTGIRLSKILFDSNSFTDFQSEYGSTESLLDVHEFGYFWRSLLKKHSFESVKKAKHLEDEIDWARIHRILVNIQHEFGKPTLFKNILGSYHLPRFTKLLGDVLYIYIERDSLDTAVSILDARKKYYDDPTQWWSYVPPDYEKIINEDYWTQIAGQVYYLKKFYRKELNQIDSKHVVRIHYKDLCNDPQQVLSDIQKKFIHFSDEPLPVIESPPNSFPFSTYNGRTEEKEQFKTVYNRLKQDDPIN